jgi:hypothetical protein
MASEIFFPADVLARARIPDELFDEIFEIKAKEEKPK